MESLPLKTEECSGDMLTMPILVVNMGGEMLYILEQRLHAQKIDPPKRSRVMTEVIQAMFNYNLVNALMKPQPMYSSASTREIFNKLAHSSIMRLNESSMDKLYDLMTMGFKYQILSCKFPHDLVSITINHLDNLTHSLKDDSAAHDLLESTKRAVSQRYRNLTTGQFYILRQTLCQFVQDQRIKVSLFMKEKIQTADGIMRIRADGEVPKGFEVPGTIRHYSDNKTCSHDTIELHNATDATPYDDTKSCNLGANMYLKQSGKKSSKAPGNVTTVTAVKEKQQTKHADFVTSELNQLASLIHIPGGDENDSGKHVISVNFDDDGMDGSDEDETGASCSTRAQEVVFDVTGANRTAEIDKEFGDFALGGDADNDQGGQDDLLSLMDNARD
eukprot:236187_1